MPVGIFLWRTAIGTFNSNQPCYFNISKWDILFLSALRFLSAMILLVQRVKYIISLGIFFKFYFIIFLLHLESSKLLNWYRLNCVKIYDNILIFLFIWWLSILLIISGNVHPNPGPGSGPRDEGFLKFMHWNVNSLSAHDFIRIPLIQSLNAFNDYDIIAITETALNNETSDDRLALDGFLPIRRDLPTGDTHGGVMIYYKNSLALRERPDLENQENTLVCEISVDKKKIIFSVIYRKFGQSKTEFDSFASNFDIMCKNINDENPQCAIYFGDFNAHSSEWWTGDDTDYEGSELLHCFTTNHLQQLVIEPTYLVGDNKSCIDLVLTDQPNLVTNCEIIPSLHTNCHHQINQVTLNIRSPSPPPFNRRVWHYERAQVDLIKRAIADYDWITELNLRNADPNLQVEHLTEVLNNVFTNFIPHDDVTIKPKAPPWTSKNISRAYHKYRRSYKSYIRNGCSHEMAQHIYDLKENYTSLVENARKEYLLRQSQKHSNPDTGIKTYWSI